MMILRLASSLLQRTELKSKRVNSRQWMDRTGEWKFFRDSVMKHCILLATALRRQPEPSVILSAKNCFGEAQRFRRRSKAWSERGQDIRRFLSLRSLQAIVTARLTLLSLPAVHGVRKVSINRDLPWGSL